MQLQLLLTAWFAAGASLYAWQGEQSEFHQYRGHDELLSESDAIDRWAADAIGDPRIGYQVVRRATDLDYTHTAYDLYFKGRRLVDTRIKVHYDRRGWVDSYSGSVGTLYGVLDASAGAQLRSRATERRRAEFVERFGHLPEILKSEPVVWRRNPDTTPYSAVLFTLVDAASGQLLQWVEDEVTGQQLAQWQPIRYADPSTKVYKKYPPTGGGGFDDVSLSGLLSANILKSSRFWVRRDELQAGTVVSLDVDPNKDFTTIDEAPEDYTPLCVDDGSGNSCPNQQFDAVNVYYHLANYRAQIDRHYGSTIAGDSAVINVFVNYRAGQAGTNNAYYISTACRSGSSGQCLVFLPPGPVSCGSGVVQFYSTAREALVIAHEYQHHITDLVTGMLMSDGPNVGDALHEGYSDYFAVSYVSALVAQPVTNIGEYAFAQCPAAQREISMLQEYTNSAEDSDPHFSGKVWASGLYDLRKQYGKDVIDSIAYRSLLFLPTKPGFQDAVTSLVKADEALYGGVHSDAIRTLYYDKLHFLGGKKGVFRDPAKGIAEVGFHSCGSVGSAAGAARPLASTMLLLLWGGMTLATARWRRR